MLEVDEAEEEVFGSKGFRLRNQTTPSYRFRSSSSGAQIFSPPLLPHSIRRTVLPPFVTLKCLASLSSYKKLENLAGILTELPG
jgi:hypothetical protein